MIRMGIVVVIGAIIVSMGVALYMYTQYQPNFIEASAGEAVVGEEDLGLEEVLVDPPVREKSKHEHDHQ